MKQRGYLCPREYRTWTPLLRLTMGGLTWYFLLSNNWPVLPVSAFFLVVFALILRQLWIAHAGYERSDRYITNTVLGKSVTLDLTQPHSCEKISVTWMEMKDKNGYHQEAYYLFTTPAAALGDDPIGYGGPGAVYRLIRRGGFLLPADSETQRFLETR